MDEPRYKAGDQLVYGERVLTFRTAAQIAELARERDRLYGEGDTAGGDRVRAQLKDTALLPGEGLG